MIVCGIRGNITKIAGVLLQLEIGTGDTSISMCVKFAARSSARGVELSGVNRVIRAITVSRTDG